MGKEDNEPIRVLQVIADLKKGGIQADVMYPVRLLDLKLVHFDTMLLSDTVGYYEEEFSKLGNIYRIPLKRKATRLQRLLSIVTNYIKVYREMIIFFKTHEPYDAVHARHLILNAPCIAAAKKAGVPVRIAHCHVNKPVRKEFKDRLYIRIYLWICARVLNQCATHRFGVTGSACDYMFGKGNGRVIKNPTVDLIKFDRKQYPDISSDKLRLIVIGSYSERKNQKFAIDVLKCLNDREVDANLTMIGYPRNENDDYLPNLKKLVNQYGMNEIVEFLPQDTNVAEALSRSDMMLIPSLQEGLPNVALEAQTIYKTCR